MATRTASAAKASINTIKSLRVGTWAVSSVFSIPAGQSISPGDVIQMIAVPDGAQVVFVGVKSSYADCVVEVGDGLDDDRYMNAATTSATFALNMFSAGLTGNGAAAPYTYSTDDTLDFTVTLASITTVAGAFYMTAILTMDPTQYDN